MVHTSKMSVVGDDDPTSLSRLLEIRNIERVSQSRVACRPDIDSTLPELDRDSRVNVLIKLEPNVRHGVAEAAREVGWGAAA